MTAKPLNQNDDKNKIKQITTFLKKNRWLILTITLSVGFVINIGFAIQLNSKVDINYLNTFKNEVINTKEVISTLTKRNEETTQTVNSNTTNTINTNENKNVNLTTTSFSYTDDDKKVIVNYMNEYLAEKSRTIQFYQSILNVEWSKFENAKDDTTQSNIKERIKEIQDLMAKHEIDRGYMQDNLMIFFNNLSR